MSATNLITIETVFCDYEFDRDIRKTYLTRWLTSLTELAKVSLPSSTDAHFLLYVSEDKAEELRIVQQTIEAFNSERKPKFHLVTYQHPRKGYGFDEMSHPDLFKSPNKSAPYRDVLYKKAIRNIPVHTYNRLIRVALDDDDFWFPWQLLEIVQAADQAYEPGKIVGVGFRQACVAYVPEKVADVVELSRHMNGNKFYVSSMESLHKQVELSPWSIPENFTAAKNIKRMGKAGVTLKTVATNKPGWIYVRWGGNMSTHNKSRYYQKHHFTTEFQNVGELFPELASGLVTRFERLTTDEQVEADRMLEETG